MLRQCRWWTLQCQPVQHQRPDEEQNALAEQVAPRDFERVQLRPERKDRFARGLLLEGSELFCLRACAPQHHIGREESARSNPKVRAGMFTSFSSLAVTSRTRNGVKPKRRAPSASASSIVLNAPMSSSSLTSTIFPECADSSSARCSKKYCRSFSSRPIRVYGGSR